MDQGDHLKRIPLILITGFLGSGKTTLLTDLLNRFAGTLRIAVVQNEFAPGHVDGELLRQTGQPFRLLEINNGSVFCACLLGDFIERLEPFISAHKPDAVFLEASGLADPMSLGEMLESPKLSGRLYLAGSWCLVDAVNFSRTIEHLTRAKNQVRIADLIWLNKIDLAGDTSGIEERIREINPFARILPTTYGSTAAIGTEQFLKPQEGPGSLGHPDPPNGKPEGRPEGITSLVVRSARTFDREAVRTFLSASSGRFYRIKGFMRISESSLLAVQCVSGTAEFRETNIPGATSELIVIGPEFDKREFSTQLLKLAIS